MHGFKLTIIWPVLSITICVAHIMMNWLVGKIILSTVSLLSLSIIRTLTVMTAVFYAAKW